MEYVNGGGRSPLSYASYTYFNKREERKEGRGGTIFQQGRERGRGHDEMHCYTRMKQRDDRAKIESGPVEDIPDVARRRVEAVTQTLRHFIRPRGKNMAHIKMSTEEKAAR